MSSLSTEYWCNRKLVISLTGPDGRAREIRVDKPFARIGTHPDGEVVLDEAELPARCCYLHGTDAGIFCYALTPDESPLAIPTGWMSSRAILRIGQSAIRVRFADSLSVSKPDEPDLRLNRAGYGDRVCLQIRSDDPAIGSAHRYCHNPLTLVGRRKPSLLRLKHETISKTHCLLYCQDDALWVVDLLSANGTLLEGEPIECARLLPGQTLELGAARLSIGEPQPNRLGNEPTAAATVDFEEPSMAEGSEVEPSEMESLYSEPSVVESTEFLEREADEAADEQTPLDELTLALSDAPGAATKEEPASPWAVTEPSTSAPEEESLALAEPDILQQEIIEPARLEPDVADPSATPEMSFRARCEELERSLAETTARAQSEIASLQQQLVAAGSESQTREAEAHRRLAAAEEQATQYAEQLDALRLQVATLESQLTSAQQQLTDIVSQRDGLKEQVEAAATAIEQHDLERQQLRQQIAVAADECAGLRLAAEAQAAALADALLAQRQAEALADQRRAELEQSAEMLGDLQTQLQQRVEQSDKELQLLRLDHERLRQDQAATIALLADRDAALSQMQTELQQVSQHSPDTTAELQQQAQMLALLTEERDRYHAEVLGVQRRLTDLIRRAADAEQQADRWQESQYAAQQKIEELQQALAAAAHSDAAPTAPVQETTQDGLEAEAALVVAQQQIASLEKQMRSIKRRARRKIRQLSSNRATPSNLLGNQPPAPQASPAELPAVEEVGPSPVIEPEATESEFVTPAVTEPEPFTSEFDKPEFDDSEIIEPPAAVSAPLDLPTVAGPDAESPEILGLAPDESNIQLAEPAAAEMFEPTDDVANVVADAPLDAKVFETPPAESLGAAGAETPASSPSMPAFDIQPEPPVVVGRARRRVAAGDDDITSRLLVYHQKQTALARRKRLLWTAVALVVLLILGGVLWSLDWSAIAQWLTDLTAQE